MKIAPVQLNYTVADLAGNGERISEEVRKSRVKGVDQVVFSELALPGYPRRDLLLRPAFIARSWEVLERLAEDLRGKPPVLGCTEDDGPPPGAVDQSGGCTDSGARDDQGLSAQLRPNQTDQDNLVALRHAGRRPGMPHRIVRIGRRHSG